MVYRFLLELTTDREIGSDALEFISNAVEDAAEDASFGDKAYLYPLDCSVTYNTGDKVLLRYVDGKFIVWRIKTHDGLFMNEKGELSFAPDAQLLDK